MRTRRKLLARVALLGAFGVLATGALAAGCTTDAADEPSGAGGALQQATGAEWIVTTNPKTGAITFAAPKNGPFALPAGPPPDEAALRFLDTYKAIFKMHAPRLELALERVDRPGDGSAHVRFVQKEGGLPVFGGTWIAHLDSAGRVTSMSGNYAVGAHAVPTTPKLGPEAAAEAAKAGAAVVEAGVIAGDLQAGTPALEVFPSDAGVVLAWAVKVTNKPGTKLVGRTIHVADASGEVLLTTSGILRRTASALPPESYPPFDLDAPPLTFPISEDDPPRLDAVGPGGVRMSVVRARQPGAGDAGVDDAGAEAGAAEPTPIASTAVTPWSDGVEPTGAAIAAQAHTKTVLDYYVDHRWGPDDQPFLGVDGTGTLPLVSFINDNAIGAVNAYWATDDAMHYGDGSPEDGIFPLSASLDVVAHELTHGVTQFTSKLIYAEGSESAAINESTSDIFAALITRRLRNDDGVDFTTGEDASLDRVPFRSMIQPELPSLLEPGGISELSQFGLYDPDAGVDNAESHIASNLPSHAFYLLTHGDTHARSRVKVPCGIGWAAADRLYWRLQTNYMQPTETFKDLALHSLAAARELQINERPVACAWVAVGVLSDDEAKNDWGVTCERDGDGGTDAGYDSGNILVTAPAQLVECPVSLTGGGVSLGGGGGW